MSYKPLDITESALRDSIMNDTPLYTQRLLMELNLEYWGQYFNLKPAPKLGARVILMRKGTPK